MRARDRHGAIVVAGDRVRVLEPQPWHSSHPFELVGSVLNVAGVTLEPIVGVVLFCRYRQPNGRIGIARVIAATVERVIVAEAKGIA